MYQRYITRLLSLYAIDPLHIHAAQKGYRNEIYPVESSTGEMVQVTFYKSELGILNRVARADHVSSYLADSGLPARRRINQRTVKLHSASRTIYAGLYNYLPGSTISWEAYTRKHIVLLGKTLSDMHELLRSYVAVDEAPIEDELGALLIRMKTYFSDGRVMSALASKLGVSLRIHYPHFSLLMNSIRRLPGKQSLHMDFVRSNILFQDAQPQDVCTFESVSISGILDFEKTATGHPVYDVARSLAFLLVDCKYKSPESVTKYFVHSGYQKRGKADLIHTGRVLDQLVLFFLIHDFYKFLRHNPYETLNQNEHFIRTRDILHNRGVLHYT